MAYAEITRVKDSNGNLINPAENEQIILLRRLIKLIESQSAADQANRQRVTIDAISAALTLATVTTVTTVAAVTAITNALPAGTNNIGSVNLAGQDQKQFIDISRTNYNTGIRRALTFS